MPFDPNAIASSQFAALLLALVFLGLVMAALAAVVRAFLKGDVVRGALVEALLLRVDRLTVVIEERNRIDEERLKWNKEHDERRGESRASGG